MLTEIAPSRMGRKARGEWISFSGFIHGSRQGVRSLWTRPVGAKIRRMGESRKKGRDAFPPPGAALFLVDVQNDFCPGGALPVPDGDRVVPVLDRMVERFVEKGAPVYASRDWHPPETTHFKAFGGPWPVHCVAGTPGAEFRRDLHIPAAAIIVSTGLGREDPGYSAFEGLTEDGRPLADDLRRRGVSSLYVGGLATDYCVRATVLDALREGLHVTVLTDAIAAITPEGGQQALDEMRAAGASLTPSVSV